MLDGRISVSLAATLVLLLTAATVGELARSARAARKPQSALLAPGKAPAAAAEPRATAPKAATGAAAADDGGDGPIVDEDWRLYGFWGCIPCERVRRRVLNAGVKLPDDDLDVLVVDEHRKRVATLSPDGRIWVPVLDHHGLFVHGWSPTALEAFLAPAP